MGTEFTAAGHRCAGMSQRRQSPLFESRNGRGRGGCRSEKRWPVGLTQKRFPSAIPGHWRERSQITPSGHSGTFAKLPLAVTRGYHTITLTHLRRPPSGGRGASLRLLPDGRGGGRAGVGGADPATRPRLIAVCDNLGRVRLGPGVSRSLAPLPLRPLPSPSPLRAFSPSLLV